MSICACIHECIVSKICNQILVAMGGVSERNNVVYVNVPLFQKDHSVGMSYVPSTPITSYVLFEELLYIVY